MTSIACTCSLNIHTVPFPVFDECVRNNIYWIACCVPRVVSDCTESSTLTPRSTESKLTAMIRDSRGRHTHRNSSARQSVEWAQLICARTQSVRSELAGFLLSSTSSIVSVVVLSARCVSSWSIIISVRINCYHAHNHAMLNLCCTTSARQLRRLRCVSVCVFCTTQRPPELFDRTSHQLLYAYATRTLFCLLVAAAAKRIVHAVPIIHDATRAHNSA